MEPRKLKGAEIVRKGGLKKRGRYLWVVPSQTHRGHYVVDVRPKEPTCTCPDYEARTAFCKHIFAVEIHRKNLVFPEGFVKEQPVSWTQDWPAYNIAQQREGEHFVQLLKELCGGILMTRNKGRGRPKAPLSDMVFSCVMKVYGTQSGRRSTTNIKSCHEQGLIDVNPHYNTISKYMNEEKLTPLLRALLIESASPLADIETNFVIDSTGFSSGMYERWYSEKYGRDKKRENWLKAHAISGTETNIVTDVIITGKEGADTTQLEELLKKTSHRFFIKEVAADKAYISRKNLMAIDDLGAIPYIPFRDGYGTGKRHIKKGADDRSEKLWSRMYHYYQFKHDEFMDHYHQRSNAETVFAMVKRKFGTSIRSKTNVAQTNEILCKFVAHNICVLISSIYELDVGIEFWNTETAPLVA